MTQEELFGLLHEVAHPELHNDIVTLGMVENPVVTDDKIQLTLLFPRSRDPFALSIKKRCEELIAARFPDYSGKISIFIKEAAPKKAAEKKEQKPFGGEDGVRRILAVSSAKGGVGKSTVTANLAVALSRLGYKVGILDADIYGPSQPMLFGVEDYRPEGEKKDGKDWILPAERFGIRIMSIGFFIDPADALMWRGPMATNALRQMIRQTLWGPLDFLLIDLPPGTGDVHLSILSELRLNGAVIVSTPQQVAVADVLRGIEMFRHSQVGVPVAGIIENMAWFTPAELPENRYYLFGKGGARALAERCGVDFLGEIPIVQSIMEGGDAGTPGSTIDARVEETYRTIARKIVENVMKTCS